tara:strand:- start:191 stop:766 length:576 start_codon:yes stop_codon:yes gene_type:complete
MKLFEVDKLSYYSPNRGYNVKLVEINGNFSFSIVVGNNEAQSIALALEGIQTPRPMTHDIILDILSSGDIKVEKIEISNFLKGTFYATIYIKGMHCGLKKIDCRPSDAIAIAIRYCYPIYIKKGVIDKLQSNNIVSDISFNSIEEFESQEEDSVSNVIEKLNYALKNAINKENYEIAAKLRDKIKSYDELK